ncbi:MAG: glycine cleavage system protein H [Bdellovibrionales bacterium]
MKELMTYMGYEWVMNEDGILTVGINDDGLAELTEVTKVNLPNVDDEVNTDEICGEIETDSGPLNLYSPVEGQVIEINEAVLEDPNLITEDSYGDGWLFRVEAKNAGDVDELVTASTNDKDE